MMTDEPYYLALMRFYVGTLDQKKKNLNNLNYFISPQYTDIGDKY